MKRKIIISENAQVKVNLQNIDNTNIQIKENDDVDVKVVGNENNISIIDNYDINLEIIGNNKSISLEKNHNIDLIFEAGSQLLNFSP